MMDETQSDTLAKGLGTSGSRRRALATLVGVGLAGSFSGVQVTAAASRRFP
jgi:hypothetical protein